jgi:hypothetical protein
MHAHETPIPELGGRTWAELELVEDDEHRILFRDQIRVRTRDGWKAVPIRVRVIRPMEQLRARRDARAAFKEMGLDEARDVDLFGEVEQLAILALAIRTAEPPHAQFADLKELSKDYDEASLRDVLARLSRYRELVDPRPPGELTDAQVWTAILAIRRVGHLGPLADIASTGLNDLLLRMAEEASRSPRVQSFAMQLASSTPELSAPES